MDLVDKINEALQINESAINFTKYLQKGKYVWLFSRGRFPNTLIQHQGGNYSILLFKSNKKFYPVTMAAMDNPDIHLIAELAKKMGMQKKFYPDLNPVKFFHQMTVIHNISPKNVHTLFPELEGMTLGDDNDRVLKVGGFEIIYDKEKEGKHLKELIGAGCDLLSKHKYEKICYGKVVATPNLKTPVLANYNIRDDFIRVSNKARKRDDAVRTLVHELGHRLYHKFLKKSQHEKIKEKYNEMLADKFQIAIGDRFEMDGREITILDTEWTRSGVRYLYSKEGKFYSATAAALSLRKFLGNKEGKETSKKVHPFQVSLYARKDAEEFFSEVFSFAIVENRKDLLDWIKSL